MKILHIENHAGIAHELAEAQKRAGHEATVIETWWNPTNQPHDLDYYYGQGSFFIDIGLMKKVINLSGAYDIVHLHGGINWKRFDILGMKFFKRKPLIVHYHGSETREGFGMYYRWLPDYKLLSRPDLLKWIPDATFIPSPVAERPYSFQVDRTPRIIHLSNDRKTKGSDLVVEAMTELQKEMTFDFCLMEKRPHAEAMKELAKSHILIDQVIDSSKIGVPSIIGVATLEAMSMGLVAVSTFDEEYRSYYPGCPVETVKPSKSSLNATIKRLLTDMERTKELGIRGMEHVRTYHSADHLAQEILRIYSSVLKGRK